MDSDIRFKMYFGYALSVILGLALVFFIVLSNKSNNQLAWICANLEGITSPSAVGGTPEDWQKWFDARKSRSNLLLKRGAEKICTREGFTVQLP